MSIFSHGKAISALQFFTDKYQDYWHTIYPINSDNSQYNYFLDNSSKSLAYKGAFTDEGIYLFLGYDGNHYEHALEIAQFGLSCWQSYSKTGNQCWLDKAILHCKWLIEQQDSAGTWKIFHKNPKYKSLSEPWISSLAQAFAISCLIRYYKYLGDERLLLVIYKAVDALELDIDSGGLKRSFCNGFIYEEYPTKELNGVLNGYIFCIFSLIDLSRFEQRYTRLLDKNLKNLKSIFPLYYNKYWTYYSLDGTYSSGFYHRLVIQQIKCLNQMGYDFVDEEKVLVDKVIPLRNRLLAFIGKVRNK